MKKESLIKEKCIIKVKKAFNNSGILKKMFLSDGIINLKKIK